MGRSVNMCGHVARRRSAPKPGGMDTPTVGGVQRVRDEPTLGAVTLRHSGRKRASARLALGAAEGWEESVASVGVVIRLWDGGADLSRSEIGWPLARAH
jgi:hypothetical protein